MAHRFFQTFGRVAALGIAVGAATSCGDVVRTGRAPVTLVVAQLTATPGKPGGAGTPQGFLLSDVLVMVITPDPCTTTNPCPTVFDDAGQATLSIEPKDPAVTLAPSANSVTITRVHIKYTRADGRNVQGVDVPYEFDGAATATIAPGNSQALSFELVRHAAKVEPPLLQLVTNSSVITTIAQVTFYGTDLAGNAVQATGNIQVNFGNFGDQ